MLSWLSQLELVRTLWLEPKVRETLGLILRAEHFDRPDLGWIAKTLCTEAPGAAPPTINELRENLSITAAPHILAACETLLPVLEKAEKIDVVRALDLGRKFVAYQEALIFGGQVATWVKLGQWGEIRNRTETLMALSGQLASEEEGLMVTRASDVASEKVSWLWPGFVPFGKVSTMEGDGGLGKSTITLDLVARLTRGIGPPFTDIDPSPFYEPSDAIVLSAEDAATDTIRPRLEAAGADLTRVHLVSGVAEKTFGKNGTETIERGISLDRDVTRLENLIVKTGARLVVIDPIVAMLGGADFHRDQDVRRILKSLARIAERRKCAVVTIRHLNKDKSGSVISRGGGSIGFVAAVRVAMLVVKHPTSDEDRVVAVYKTNLSKAPQPVMYRFKTTEQNPEIANIEWTTRSNMTVETLMSGGKE